MSQNAEANENPVRRWLAKARDRLATPAELSARWRMVRITLVCPAAGGVAGNPNAPAKIRGALGRALAEVASPAALTRGACDWPAPCAYDLLYNTQGRVTARLEIPKPFVLALDRDGSSLVIALTLFGIAGDWAGEMADGLIRALRSGLDSGTERRPLAPEKRSIELAEGVPPPRLPGGARLDFLTPFAMRAGERLHANPPALLTGLGNRVSGLALWQGARLALGRVLINADVRFLAVTRHRRGRGVWPLRGRTGPSLRMLRFMVPDWPLG